MTPKASIIILDYNKSQRVCENVTSIFLQKINFDVEVIVVDNSCNPRNAQQLKTLEKFDRVKVLINESNCGYVRGNNLAVEKSSGEFILIVNPDIVWRDEITLQKLIDFMEQNPRVGVLGPKQINDGDGSVAMTVRAFPKLSLQIARRTDLRRLPHICDWVAYDEMRHLDYTKTQPVDWLQSSFWVTRRSLWDSIGGLDKRYWSFMSDSEYCFQVWKRGFEVLYFPEAVVYADGIRCSAGGITTFFKSPILRQHVKDAVKYQAAHLFQRNPRLRADQGK